MMQDELHASFQELWKKYLPVNLARLRSMQEFVAAVREGRSDPEMRTRAHKEAHKMSGSAGTYGFAEVSRVARSIEVTTDGEVPITADQLSKLESEVKRLAELLEAASG